MNHADERAEAARLDTPYQPTKLRRCPSCGGSGLVKGQTNDELLNIVERVFGDLPRPDGEGLGPMRPEARSCLATDLAALGDVGEPAHVVYEKPSLAERLDHYRDEERYDAIDREREDCEREEPHMLEADGPWGDMPEGSSR